MTLSRLPVLQVANHLLPWPRTTRVRSMRRHALEVTVQAAFGPLRVTNTHLEFHSAEQRDAQIARLLDLQQEASSQSATVAKKHAEPYAAQTVAGSGLLCGDFNFDVSDPQHGLLQNASRPGLNYRDAWTITQPDRPREPTCGVYDREQWPDGADCRDFIFVSEDLGPRVQQVSVDGNTAASDHQPVMIEMAD
jgi:endonuclease/exonuclease/phosphatase family metal-dependent hydrolase